MYAHPTATVAPTTNEWLEHSAKKCIHILHYRLMHEESPAEIVSGIEQGYTFAFDPPLTPNRAAYIPLHWSAILRPVISQAEYDMIVETNTPKPNEERDYWFQNRRPSWA
jgi:hypothetical protein